MGRERSLRRIDASGRSEHYRCAQSMLHVIGGKGNGDQSKFNRDRDTGMQYATA